MPNADKVKVLSERTSGAQSQSTNQSYAQKGKKCTLQDMRNVFPTIRLRNSGSSALCARHKKSELLHLLLYF